MPVALSSSLNNQKCLQALPNIPQGAKSSLPESSWRGAAAFVGSLVFFCELQTLQAASTEEPAAALQAGFQEWACHLRSSRLSLSGWVAEEEALRNFLWLGKRQ